MYYSTKIPISIFPHQVILIYAPTLEDCAKIAKQSYDVSIEYSDNCDAVTERHGTTTTICLKSKSYLDKPSILVHETNHAAFNILYTIGARVSPDTEEFICYIQQYIYDECKKFLDTIPSDEFNKSE